VEDAIKGHYAAIGAGDFQKAYSYFGPTIRSQVPQQGWIDSHRADQIRGTTINSLKVNSVSGNQANATVDVTSQDKTGAPRFLLTWNLVKESGQWKLDDQASGQQIA
jgi:hypothetical protein